MGNAGVSNLSRDDIHGIAQFNEKDIKRLYNRFKALDADGSGQLDPSEIFSVAELNENPLVQRVISVLALIWRATSVRDRKNCIRPKMSGFSCYAPVHAQYGLEMAYNFGWEHLTVGFAVLILVRYF